MFKPNNSFLTEDVLNLQEMRERRNKLQAELAARVDLTPDEAAKLQEAHEVCFRFSLCTFVN